MTFKVPIHFTEGSGTDEPTVKDEQITVVNHPDSVSKSDIRQIVKKVAQILAAQGLSCCECVNTRYKLYPLSDCEDSNLKYTLVISCSDSRLCYEFELMLAPIEPLEFADRIDKTEKDCNETERKEGR